MIFTTENSYLKLFLDITFSIVNRFLNFLQHILGQTKRQILQRKKGCLQLNEIEDIREIPLSEGRNYTLNDLNQLIYVFKRGVGLKF